jgi:site-specific recombinase XerD
MHNVKLSDFLNCFVVEHETGVAENTILCYYRPAITVFRRYLQKEPALEDLTDDNLNNWTQAALKQKANLTTHRQRRGAILALWRAAVQSNRVANGPRKIRKLPRVNLIIEAWTREEIQQLLEAIEQPRFRNARMPKSELNKADFLLSLARAAYETGMRLGDLMSFERSWIRVDREGAGYITVVQSKTGHQKTSRIEPATMVIIDRLMKQQSKRRLIWPLSVERKCFYRLWRSVVEAALLHRGTFRWLRRSGVTHVEIAHPGCGHRHAGHMDSRVTAKHYIDRRQMDSLVVSPAPLQGSRSAPPLPEGAGAGG